MFCPQYGKQIPDASKFCFKCGTSVEAVAGITREARQPEPVTQLQVESAIVVTGAEAKAIPYSVSGGRNVISKDCPKWP